MDRTRTLLAIILVVLGCADGTLPPADSPSDPSNPRAAEAPVLTAPSFGTAAPMPTSAPGAASQGMHGGGHEGHGAPPTPVSTAPSGTPVPRSVPRASNRPAPPGGNP